MNCKKCKRELPDDAVFCLYCGKKQSATRRKAPKRPNGAGSVYQRKDLKGAPWFAVTPKTRTAAPIILGRYATKALAEGALAEYKKHPTSKINYTLQQLYDEWRPLGTHGKSQKLEEAYKNAFNRIQELHNCVFRELTTGQLQGILYELEKPRDGLTTGYSYASRSHVKTLLGLLYKYAVENNIVDRNYAQYLKVTRNQQAAKDCFNSLQLETMRKNLYEVPFADWIYFMCYTGVRISELLNLTRTSIKGSKGKYAIYGGVKSAAGKNRVIPVHKKIEGILESRLSLDGDYLFAADNGRPYSPHIFRTQCYYPALEAMKLPKLTPHATRRTFATLMSLSGVREEDFISLMGHSDYKVDINHYIVQSAEKLKAAIDKIP